ncbi:MAG: PorV/PorQ family protein [bacterium]
MKQKIITLLIITPMLLFSQGTGVKEGFDFLRTDLGSRPLAMGGAFTSVAGDLYSMRYNPASLVGVKNLSATCSYLNQIADINTGYIGFNKTLKTKGQLGFSLSYINYGEMRKRDTDNNDLGSFYAGDVLISSTYAASFSPNFHYGATIKYINSQIDNYVASALALDIGLLYKIPKKNLNLGVSFQNIGKSVDSFYNSEELLPSLFRFGISQHLAHLPLLISFNLYRFFYSESDIFLGLYWAVGGEFTITENFFFRWGYNSRGQEQKTGAMNETLAGISLGLGIVYGKYHFDYGLSSFGSMGNLNCLTITAEL